MPTVACLLRARRFIGSGYDHVYSEADQLFRETGKPFYVTLRAAVLDLEVASVYISKLAQARSHDLVHGIIGSGSTNSEGAHDLWRSVFLRPDNARRRKAI